MSGAFDQLSGATAIRVAGKSAKNIADRKAEAVLQEGKANIARAGFASLRHAKKSAADMARIEAHAGKVGAVGSPVFGDIVEKQKEESEIEGLLFGFEGEVANLKAITQSIFIRAGGQLSRMQAKSSARAANLDFGIKIASLGAGFIMGGTPTPKTQTPQQSSSFLSGTGNQSYGRSLGL